MIVSSSRQLEIGKRYPEEKLGPYLLTDHDEVLHFNQPFVALREATIEEYFDSLGANAMYRVMFRMRGVNRFFYEISMD